MRILIASPQYEDSFGDNVLRTLCRMGHEARCLVEVKAPGYLSFPNLVLRAAMTRIRGDHPLPWERRIRHAVRTWRPQLVLALTEDIHPEILEDIRKSCRRALWWGDTPANSMRWGIVSPGWDAVFIKDEAAVSKLRIVGVNAHLLDEAMNPEWHRPVACQAHDGIVVAGNYYAYRQLLVERLGEAGYDMHLYGLPPPLWARPFIKKYHRGRYIVGEEKSRVFGEALAALNSFNVTEGNSLNCRAFEIAGAAGLQLMEFRPAIARCFEPGKEMLTYETWDELLEHLKRAKREPFAMKKIREAGAKRALADHTYEHRLKEILKGVA